MLIPKYFYDFTLCFLIMTHLTAYPPSVTFSAIHNLR